MTRSGLFILGKFLGLLVPQQSYIKENNTSIPCSRLLKRFGEMTRHLEGTSTRVGTLMVMTAGDLPAQSAARSTSLCAQQRP
jgi:hypothetical protein